MTNGKARKKSVCAHCGCEIKWIRSKGTPKAVPVEARSIYFLPDPDGRPYVMANGKMQTGRESNDGILGFRKHDCPMLYRKKVLSEEELQRRQWA